MATPEEAQREKLVNDIRSTTSILENPVTAAVLYSSLPCLGVAVNMGRDSGSAAVTGWFVGTLFVHTLALQGLTRRRIAKLEARLADLPDPDSP